MSSTAGKVPDKPAVNRSEKEVTPLGPLLSLWNVVQYPAELCGREISIYQQTCFFSDGLLQTLSFQLLA